jgi:energy-coupling factor transporter ATP-binding protein EcfA2
MNIDGVEKLKAVGKIASIKADVKSILSLLGELPLWRPSVALGKEAEQILDMIDHIEERFEKKLVVTLLGPSGSGKSTLLNALAGDDGLSPAGHQRPTTRGIVVFSREQEDADQLQTRAGLHNVQIKTTPRSDVLKHVLLVDTPDTDSTLNSAHVPLIENTIAVSDVLICVFDGENPKRRDHADFLSAYVKKFQGESLVVLLNKSDRLAEEELRKKILPDFQEYIGGAWGRAVDRLFCISARRHLRNPQWDEKAGPRHDYDQFENLKQLIFDGFNRAGYVVDRRLKNAQSLKDYLFEALASAANNDRHHVEAAAQKMRALEKTAVKETFRDIRRQNQEARQEGFSVSLYGRLTQRWLGPVGWLVAIWSRIMVLGSGIGAFLRFGQPLRQISSMAGSLKALSSGSSVLDTKNTDRFSEVTMRAFRARVLKEWPDVADSLVQGRFDRSVLKSEMILTGDDVYRRDLSMTWRAAINQQIENASRQLSRIWLQILFNLPVIAILVHAGWMTAEKYFNGTYLSGDFFLHAFITLLIALFLSFFLLQGLIRLFAGRNRIYKKAFQSIIQRADHFRTLSKGPLGVQIERFFELAGRVSAME